MMSFVPEILWRCSFSDVPWGQLSMCELDFCCWLCIQSGTLLDLRCACFFLSYWLLRLLQWSWLAVKMGRPDQRHGFSPNICFSMTGSTSLSLSTIFVENIRHAHYFSYLWCRNSGLPFWYPFYKACAVYFTTRCFSVNKNSPRLFTKKFPTDSSSWAQIKMINGAFNFIAH